MLELQAVWTITCTSNPGARTERDSSPGAPGMGWGVDPQTCRLETTVKHTGQESGSKLCEIFEFWSFLQSKPVDNVCKLFQLRPQIPYRGPHWKTPWAVLPQLKIPGAVSGTESPGLSEPQTVRLIKWPQHVRFCIQVLIRSRRRLPRSPAGSDTGHAIPRFFVPTRPSTPPK